MAVAFSSFFFSASTSSLRVLTATIEPFFVKIISFADDFFKSANSSPCDALASSISFWCASASEINFCAAVVFSSTATASSLSISATLADNCSSISAHFFSSWEFCSANSCKLLIKFSISSFDSVFFWVSSSMDFLIKSFSAVVVSTWRLILLFSAASSSSASWRTSMSSCISSMISSLAATSCSSSTIFSTLSWLESTSSSTVSESRFNS
mmetsp:Transcript_23308/g.55013  ORF Transcript_23308/g.55013 Transcript_23308/m.55013 type:complete len:211 (-) Transcript_23308:995-1627(-)